MTQLMFCVYVALAVLTSGPLMAAQTTAPVKTRQGLVTGIVDDGVAVYKGIPYAASTAGKNRWRPPQAAPAWDGERKADDYGCICPQVDRKKNIAPNGPMSEDCLNLNIWAPASATADSRLPVMVWIHGGSFRYGAGSWPYYDGRALVAEGIVLVTINYRLGYFGRFGHPALSKESRARYPDQALVNYHLMDQIAALQWVKADIKGFGGNPDNVTIFGYSAGGVSVNFLMVTPQSKGLFQRAIAQSGGVDMAQSLHITRKHPFFGSAESQGVLLAKHMGIPNDTAAPAKLRALGMQQILQYQSKEVSTSLNPMVDGILISDDLQRLYADGKQHSVPIIQGANSWEDSILHYSVPKIPPIAWLAGVDKEAAYKVYGRLPDQELGDLWFKDRIFLHPARELAARMTTVNTPAWLYHYSYVPGAMRSINPGGAHGDETAMIFGVLPGLMTKHGLKEADITDEDRKKAAEIRRYWTNFARNGNPNASGLTSWPLYNPAKDQLLDIGQETKVRPNLLKKRLDHQKARDAARAAK